MTLMKMLRSLFCLFFIGFASSLTFSQIAVAASFEIVLLDPPEEVTLGSNEQLYVNVHYVSDIPIRFLASALRSGKKREVGAVMSSAGLHASGKAAAMVWIAFANPTHIDEVVVTAYDENWNSLGSVSSTTDTRWSGAAVETPREPAQWVLELQKKERLKLDYLFDPSPKQPELASDTIFVLALLSVPIYIILQIRMLRRYHQRWRELATVPLITALPLLGYAFWVGIGFNLRLWPPFFMYFMLFASGYLLTLWAIKKIRE